MTRVVLDTNIWIYLLKGKKPSVTINEKPLTSPDLYILLPAAVKAELFSIAHQRNWGSNRKKQLEKLISRSVLIHTNNAIVHMFAEIDAFSQGKHPEKNLAITPRNMGKNDLWIAATAAVSNSILLTADRDFDHLQNTFLEVNKLEPTLI